MIQLLFLLLMGSAARGCQVVGDLKTGGYGDTSPNRLTMCSSDHTTVKEDGQIASWDIFSVAATKISLLVWRQNKKAGVYVLVLVLVLLVLRMCSCSC